MHRARDSEFSLRLYLPALSVPVARPRMVPEAPLPANAQVLIADDRQSHRAVLRGFLSPLGLAVQEVEGGRRRCSRNCGRGIRTWCCWT